MRLIDSASIQKGGVCYESSESRNRADRYRSRSVGLLARASCNLYLDRRQRVVQLLVLRGQLGRRTPVNEPASDYVFAADGWNTTQTTIAIDGRSRSPDIDTLTFNEYADTPLTIQIGANNALCLSPSIAGATTISVAQTGVKYTIAGSSGAWIQLSSDQQWSVDGTLEISATIWDEGESPSPGVTKTGVGTLILSGNNSFVGPITVAQGVLSVSSIAATQGQACNLGRGTLTLSGGALNYTGPSVSTNRGFTLGTGGGTVNVQNAATSLAFAGTVTGSQQAD